MENIEGLLRLYLDVNPCSEVLNQSISTNLPAFDKKVVCKYMKKTQ